MNARLLEIIDKNNYIKNCKTNKKINKNSLSYLISREMSQSDSIKLGICIEKIFSDIIKEYSEFISIKCNNKKNIKEKDHLFLDEKK